MTLGYEGKLYRSYFYVGKEFPIGNNGEMVHYPPKTWSLGLPMHNGDKDIVLKVPGDLRTADLQWLAISSPDYNHDHGHVVFFRKKPRELKLKLEILYRLFLIRS